MTERMLKIGDEISKRYVFIRERIRQFVELSGDVNPLHFDEEAARASRFGGIIASGTHTAAVLTGLLSSGPPAGVESVGLGFSIRFKKAVPAETATMLIWTVTGVEPHPRLKGDLLTLAGRIEDDAGTVYVTSEATIVIWPA